MSENEEKEKKVGLIELEDLKDLIHLIVQTPFLTVNHTNIAGKHYYFVISGGLPGFAHIIYYYQRDTPIEEKYIIYNSLDDTLTYGNKLETRGGIKILPIINIKNQNIIKPEDIKF
ncbi:MAG: hypothetical protein ACTSRS_18030 [Candidatus Helarchaeota archaeon]